MSATPLRRWTRAEYNKAAELGLFRPEERLELLDGQIVQKMSPQSTPHVVCLRKIAKWLEDQVAHDFDVRQQAPIALSDASEPEPDIAVARGVAADYLAGHPGPSSLALVVEVADSSLARDRRLKVPLYAKAGITEFWLVDLEARSLNVYREPAEDGFHVVTILTEDRTVEPLFLHGREVRVGELLP